MRKKTTQLSFVTTFAKKISNKIKTNKKNYGHRQIWDKICVNVSEMAK